MTGEIDWGGDDEDDVDGDYGGCDYDDDDDDVVSRASGPGSMLSWMWLVYRG